MKHLKGYFRDDYEHHDVRLELRPRLIEPEFMTHYRLRLRQGQARRIVDFLNKHGLWPLE